MSNEIQRYVDPAMFKAEEMPAEALDRPRVHLLWMTPDPLGAAAAMNAMYTGMVKRSLSDVAHEDRVTILEQMRKTALKTPLEAIKLHFLIEGVTRGFTHQLVRQRTAAYAQESTRFAVFGEDQRMPVGSPPSLAGAEKSRFPTQNPLLNKDYTDGGSLEESMWDNASDQQKAQWHWERATQQVEMAYRNMVKLGVPAEDARGLLPTNLLTRIHYVTDLRALFGVAGVRLCTQAQFEWRLVFSEIARAIRNYNPYANFPVIQDAAHRMAIVSNYLSQAGRADAWQYEAIADMFRPICYATGKCEFLASADRLCSIRDRVQANHEINRPSSDWDDDCVMTDVKTGNESVFIGAIRPAEWLLDPGAARPKGN